MLSSAVMLYVRCTHGDGGDGRVALTKYTTKCKFSEFWAHTHTLLYVNREKKIL